MTSTQIKTDEDRTCVCGHASKEHDHEFVAETRTRFQRFLARLDPHRAPCTNDSQVTDGRAEVCSCAGFRPGSR